MARNRETKIELTAYDDLFQTDESRAEAALSKIRDIPLSEIDEFPDHPFKVLMDEDMEQLVESIKRNGVMTPATVRLKDDGRYELISGHRRKKACELAGLETLKCEVKDLTRDEAIIIMVESNLQRSVILPSEKAFAYKMRLEAMKRQAGRPTKDNYSPLGNNSDFATSSDELAEKVGESKNQIFRFIRLTELVPEILQMVDEKQIAFRPAVEISYLAEEQQYTLLEAMSYNDATPSLAQARGQDTKKIQLYVIIKSEVNEVNKILIVEDEQSIAEMVKLCLCKNGYMCEIVNDGMAATQKIEEKRYDLILLDIMLPDIDGYDLIEYIKQFDIPVIFVTAKTSVPDRVKGLKLGAEDYISKPFDLEELLARVATVLRRFHKTDNILEVGKIKIDTLERTVLLDGELVVLPAKEYDLLLYLVRNKNIALYRETIFEQVWQEPYLGNTRTIDLHIQRLKKKLDLGDAIETIYKVGYKFRAEKLK